MNKIEGNKIYLTPITKEDTPNIVAWRNNPKVRNNFIYRGLFTEEGHNHWMDTKVASGEVVQFIIRECDSHRPVGSVFIRDIDKEQRIGEYGIFIGEDDARGKGYGSEAAKLMLQYAFESIKLHKVMLRVFAFNKGAIGSYENAGFVQEAYLRDHVFVDGKYHDLVLMAAFED